MIRDTVRRIDPDQQASNICAVTRSMPGTIDHEPLRLRRIHEVTLPVPSKWNNIAAYLIRFFKKTEPSGPRSSIGQSSSAWLVMPYEQ